MNSPLTPLHFFKTKIKFSFRINEVFTIKDEDKKFSSHNTAHAVQKFCAIIFQGVQNFLTQIALTKWQV
jgi:hypothetical protein